VLRVKEKKILWEDPGPKQDYKDKRRIMLNQNAGTNSKYREGSRQKIREPA